ncbi:MAG: hypothetical protein CLLPBCKN_005129 [Chroococcidiopsis cubana SAG 39.79]|nr:hypothetical protein [Chroococcidiopsis cubana SAG 39.79]
MDINLPDAQWQGQAVSGADISRVLKIKRKQPKFRLFS